MNEFNHNTAKDQIKKFIERIEYLEEQKSNIADDINAVYAEARAYGYDSKILRKCVQIRKKDKDDIAEEQAMLQIYLDAIGLKQEGLAL